MASKDSDKQFWTDPKDYGLPWVEIKSLKPSAGPENPEKLEVLAEQVKVVPVSKGEISPIVEPKTQKPEKKSSPSDQKNIAQKATETVKKPKSKRSWIWVVLVLALIISGVIAWQLTSNPSEAPIIQNEVSSLDETPKLNSTESQVPEETPSSEETQEADNQWIIENNSEENPNISKPADSGTTIAQKVSGNLIRIEAQEERPQYFIVAGSLPTEAEALKLASNFQKKSADVYLIIPYSDSKNFRLAIGKYGSFRLAAEELEKIKSQYIEELWILKY
jgi:cytoskeletal protein RodZ